MIWVVDSSIALSLVLPDEKSPVSERIFRARQGNHRIVPLLWHYEVSNGLIGAYRRRRLTREELAGTLNDFLQFEVKVDATVNADVLRNIQQLAVEYGLSAYDATYLELAERHGARLATLDTTLARAARSRGIKRL